MKSLPLRDVVAIDTNVFEQLLNREQNKGGHIGHLLARLGSQGVALLVDDKGRIEGEYANRLKACIENSTEESYELQILRFWFVHPRRRETREVQQDDALMSEIKKIVIENTETTDRFFVYVAMKTGNTLVSNDRRHIVEGPKRERAKGLRRGRLVKATKKLGSAGAQILTSWEAYKGI